MNVRGDRQAEGPQGGADRDADRCSGRRGPHPEVLEPDVSRIRDCACHPGRQPPPDAHPGRACRPGQSAEDHAYDEVDDAQEESPQEPVPMAGFVPAGQALTLGPRNAPRSSVVTMGLAEFILQGEGVVGAVPKGAAAAALQTVQLSGS